MKNTPRFVTEFIITLIIAGLISAIITAALAFVGFNVNGDSWITMTTANSIGSVIFGLLVGYKLNSLLREHRPSKF